MQRKKEKKKKEESWFLSILVNQCRGYFVLFKPIYIFSHFSCRKMQSARGLYFYFVLLLSSVRQQSEE